MKRLKQVLINVLDIEEEQIKDYFMLGSYPGWQNTMFRQLGSPMYQRGAHVHGQAFLR